MDERCIGHRLSVADRIREARAKQLLHGVRSGHTRVQNNDDRTWGFAQTPHLSELELEVNKLYKAGHPSEGGLSPHAKIPLLVSNNSEDPRGHATGQTALLKEDKLPPSNQAESSSSRQIQTSPLIHTLYLDALKESRTLRSPHCEVEQAKILGVQAYLDGLAGSIVLPWVSEDETERVRGQLKQHINKGWSDEALRCGIAQAKSGTYNEAMRYYDRAIELFPGNADAFVARGAAHANMKHLVEAANDFKTALSMDSNNVNAMRYLEAVRKRLPQERDQDKHKGGNLQNVGLYGSSVEVVASERKERSDPHSSTRVEMLSPPKGLQDLDDRKIQGKEHSRSPSSASTSDTLSSGDSSESDLEGEDVKRALEMILQARKMAKHLAKVKKKEKKRKSKQDSKGSKKKKRRKS
ncbi:hypothetical protein CEUSTIGMA_g4930.t1 [Chlamydomonas eustigma]|uniref:Uncharacterized protein n=1 Tax=Chlamydomonas eustigma TaxID=1157962 RepID=A0A250X353_9CHLO|nr:hypothetical protein CEUSTIGMA_g4930.t1 [Chlamydomonas eustigma]|eukprot:GAX77486.1 hypothetical protein CEUSTIGMA_g4930.t1 [Chlamydomonas eustigma]